MSAGAGGPRVRRLFARARAADNLASILFAGIGSAFLAIGTVVASGIFTVADLIIIPATALGRAAGGLVNAIFGSAANIIFAGGATSAVSIGPGGQFALGPAGFVLGIGAALGGFLLINRYLTIRTTSNFIPGLSFDIPYPGIQGPEEETNR